MRLFGFNQIDLYRAASISVVPLLFLSGCFQVAPWAPTETPTPAENATPTATFTVAPTSTNTATPTRTPTPTRVPTSTPLPEDLLAQIEQTYMAMLLIQVNAEMVMEMAHRVQAGELDGWESFGALLATAALIGGVEEARSDVVPPDFLTDDWENALSVHDATRFTLVDWIDKKFASDDVIEEMTNPVRKMEMIMMVMEDKLGDRYGIERSDLADERREVLKMVEEMFEKTPTPSPSN